MEHRLFDLTGMTALVTGASGGIGSAIARMLAAQGARVAISGSNQAKLRLFREELDDHRPQHVQAVDHVAIACNLADADAVEKLVPAAVDSLGKLDILVNNAGITRDNLAMRMKDEEWDAVIRVNLEASFRLMRAACRPMMKAKFGRIVTITSVVGATGNPGQVNYAAAKGGLVAMSKSLAQELATRGITVNCVAPGFIRTAMTEALSDAQKASIDTRIPAGGLRHRPDAARQRRHGDVRVTSRGTRFIPRFAPATAVAACRLQAPR
jgi:3-oxoacyl-[acyl-carrier protein] reductase